MESHDSQRQAPAGAPRLLLLGPVELVGAPGPVEPTKRPRLTELAAILLAHPGCTHHTIDACYSPGLRVGDNARNTQMSKLRRWLGKNETGEEYLPRYEFGHGGGYRLHPSVTSDWDEWLGLLPDGAESASTDALERALSLVRGRPFEGVRARRYGWADQLRHTMVSAIVDASYELARRRLMGGRWRAANDAVLLGLAIEPFYERLWRARILAVAASGNRPALVETVDRLMAIAEDWGGELEPETTDLLASLRVAQPAAIPV